MRPARDDRGFTLSELLVTLAILGLVIVATVTVHRGVLQSYVTGSNKTEVQQNARVALERIARELRQTPSALTAAAGTSLTLIDQDTGLAVTYALAGTILNRTTNGGTSAVVGNVTALSFVYRDVNNAVTAVLANIARVDVTITTASEDAVVAGGVADVRAEATTSVRLRNL